MAVFDEKKLLHFSLPGFSLANGGDMKVREKLSQTNTKWVLISAQLSFWQRKTERVRETHKQFKSILELELKYHTELFEIHKEKSIYFITNYSNFAVEISVNSVSANSVQS